MLDSLPQTVNGLLSLYFTISWGDSDDVGKRSSDLDDETRRRNTLVKFVATPHDGTQLLTRASSGSDDADFVGLMLAHHRAAINMAVVELAQGKEPQMRRLAQEISIDQQSEIDLLQLWLKQHGHDSQK